MSTSTETSAPPRITKRKLDEVISALDDAVNATAERPTPAKRVQTRPPSLYSSLSKLGFGRFASQSDFSDSSASSQPRSSSPTFSSLLARWNSQPDLASTPSSSSTSKRARLSTILSKASSRSHFLKPRPKLPSLPSGSGSSDPLANASPSSLQAFLARLATFTRTSYSTQPDALNPARVAACGWHCPPASQFSFTLPSVSTPGTPKSGSKIVSLPGTPESSSKGESASSTSGMDRLHCAICKVSWTVAPTRGMTRDAANALTERQAKMLVEKHKDLCPWRKQQCDLSIYRIPLKTPLQTARDIVKAAKAMDEPMSNVEVAHPLMPEQLKRALHILKNVPLSDTDPAPEDDARPSTSALLAALFGWELAPAPRPPPPRRISSTFSSWSRASSRASTPAPDSPTPAKRTDAMLHCTLCQRRVGLWTQRALNVAREHRVYCPYIARTAVLPTLPSTTSTALVEGWRARVGVLLRYSLGLRGRGRGTVDSMDVDATGEDADANGPEEEEELARVQGMVRAVKAAAGGGGEVRKYVRSLLEPLKAVGTV